ncbi:alpha/beta hydrolase [Kallotenue papyrolyticum]|uniref:alpha/beta hydrolase n=1 Tax=Kallotenue papyrolyticum TaxID=1325125 RepID=UPI000492C5B8|nr:alpha/beta fold hydrolase [Kallotenue papyrolyticum]
MGDLLLTALWWLVLATLLSSVRSWRGLSLLSPARWWLPATLLAVLSLLLLPRLRAIQWPMALAASALGLATFLLLAIWHTRRQPWEPLLAPGEHAGRRICAVEVPIAGGPLPGLLVEPLNGSQVGVLVLHGAGDHKAFYAWPRLYALADAGFAALAIDVDGHGANPRPLDFPAVLEDVAAGVAWLRQRYQQVAVIGISQGGCIAARAVAEGLNVDALVIMAAPISVTVTRAVIRREALIVLHPAAWALLRDLGALPLLRMWRSGGIRGKISYVDLIQRLDLLGSVARIRCPLLLCYAAHDAVVPRRQALAIAAAAPPGATFMLVRGATHLSLPIDRRALRRVSAWLQEALTTTARLDESPVAAPPRDSHAR